MAESHAGPSAAARREALIRATLERRRSGGGTAPGGAELPARAPALPPRAAAGAAPLSFAQERLWFLDRLGNAGGRYNISLVLRLEGALAAAALERALGEVIRRHETLRTRIDRSEGEPRQVVEAPDAGGVLARIDLRRLGAARAESEARRLTGVMNRYPFDLSRAPLLRAALVRTGERSHLLDLVVHHIVSDGWSMGVLRRELSILYAAYAEGSPSPLPEIEYQYGDFTRWQREWLRGGELARQLAFWRERLSGMPEELRLPTDRPRPPVQSYRGAAAVFAPGLGLARGLEALARAEGGTLFMVLLAGLAALLGRYSGQDDFGVGAPIANRTRVETEPLIGLFVNTLVLRCDLSGDPTFRELLRRLRDHALDAYGHQDLPFEKLVAELRPRRSLSHSPLFQVLFVVQNTPASPPAFAGLDVRTAGTAEVAARFDLELVFTLRDGALAGHLIYNRDLFDHATVRRMTGHLARLLEGAAEDAERPLSGLPLLTRTERHHLLREVNDTAAGAPGPDTLHGWIVDRAARVPERVALVFEEARLSYGELDRRSAALARRLRGLGVGPDTRVGIAAERSLELLVALLAVLRAGGAYVPLDPAYPADRLSFMLEDSGVRWLLVQGRLLTRLPEVPAGVEVVDLEARPAAWEDEEDGAEAEPAGAGPPDLAAAYTIYTSGSTGRPKGAVNSHRAIVNRLVWMQDAFRLTADDRVLQKTPASFDVSVWELFWPLMVGACLVVARPEGHKDSAYLARTIGRERITTLHFVPSMLQVFLGERDLSGCRALRRVIASGEALPADLVERFFERLPAPAELHNLYGPTEAAVDVTWWPCERGAARRTIPIGRPIANVSIHVADSRPGGGFRLTPAGVPGEVLIGGVNLARGYLGRPGLTAERFVPDPFPPASPRSPSRDEPHALPGEGDGKGTPPPEPLPAGWGARLYRTGDLGRRLPGGEVEFLGRLDHQVKVRGFRIELGEIESRLLEHPAVREAVVVARGDSRGDTRLVVYLTLGGGGEAPALRAHPAQALRAFLEQTLPDHMLPSAFVILDELPLNPSGKVDRRALPDPEAPPVGEGAPPRSGVERAVAAIWCEVLGREAVGAEDSFFDLGGHSLLLVEVQRRLERELGSTLEIVDLFRYPTVRALAGALAPPAEAAERAVVRTVPAPAAGGAIAIVGMAARVPGAAGLDELWRLLEEGREGLRVLTDDELRACGVSEEEWSAPGYVRRRGVLDGGDGFDGAFFGYSPRECQVMDPQQRVFLEAAWEAMEHAGYDSRRTGGRVGVYAGAGMNSYLFNLLAHPEVIDAVGTYQAAIANKHDSLPTRVSYELDLTGPSVNVQTACSTSLVAVHLACRALLGGECEMAIAGGVTVSGTPTAGYRYQAGGITSPDGHCRAFDAEARGTVGGEGVGVVVLKRLAEALADGDTVHAVVRGTGVNNDGAGKQGFTAPGVQGQAAAIEAALAAAGVDPSTVSYVEAHGTGTELGDPIEIAALTQAFRSRAAEELPAGGCALGSIKTNIGHLDAAAGVAGLIKAVLALGRRRLPPSLHFRRPNPKIGLDSTPFRVHAEAADWPAVDGRPRRAGVSSFGIGGTNAHAVLEEASEREAAGPSRPWQLLLLSARTPEALEEATARLAGHLRRTDPPPAPLADVAYTLRTGRRPWELRRAVVCRSAEEGAALLAGRETAGARKGRVEGRAAPGTRTGVTFLFPGQGAQHPGMAEDLYRHEPVFRETLDRCLEALAPELRPALDGELRDLLFPGDGEAGAAAERLRETALAQPALFAVEYSLAALWRSWGVEPEAILGHSLGEYVAACLAGVFSLEDALGLVAVRGRLMQSMPPGAMLAVPMGEDEVRPWLDGGESGLSLAAVNGPEAVVVSGPPSAVAALAERLPAARPLHTSHAFHSPSMEPVLAPFAEALRRVTLCEPRVPFVSNLTGTWITAAQATDPEYWTRQLRQTVRFADGLATLLGTPGRVLLEVGPGRGLATLARQHPGHATARAIVPSLPPPRSPEGAGPLVLSALGRLWAAGVEVDWDGFHAGERRHRVPLPTYPFQRRRYWVSRGARRAAGERGGELALRAIADAGPAEPVEPAPPTGRRAPGLPGYAAPESDLERRIAALWREMLGAEAIGRHDDFFDLGGSSLLAVRLLAKLRDGLGVDLDPHVLVEAPTVAELAARVEEAGFGEDGEPPREPSAGPASRPLLVEIRPGDPSLPPLFLVHPAGGHVYRFRELARALAEAGFGGPVLAFRAPGLDEGEEPPESIGEMAHGYLEEARRARPAGAPFLLAGSSMGGMVAYEMARLLREEGEEVGLVALLDTFGPGQWPELFTDGAPPADPGPEQDRSRGEGPAEAVRAREVAAANTRAMLAYRPPAVPGRVVFLRAAERRPGDPPHPELAWIGAAAGGTEVHVVPGDHDSMHEPPHVAALARVLARHLPGRRSGGPPRTPA